MSRSEELRSSQQEVVKRELGELYEAIRDHKLVCYRTPFDLDRLVGEMMLLANASFEGRKVVDWSGKGRIIDPKSGKAESIEAEKFGAGGLLDLCSFLEGHSSPCIVLVPKAELFFGKDNNNGDQRRNFDAMLTIREELSRQDWAYRTVVFQVGPGESLPREVAEMAFPVERSVSGEDRYRALANLAPAAGRSELLLPKQSELILAACAGLSVTRMKQVLLPLLRSHLGPEEIAEKVLWQREKMGAMAVGKWWQIKEVGGEKTDELIGWDGFLDFITRNKMRSGGLLLVGPSGTGKTTAARKIAEWLHRPLFTANIAAWLGSLHGETERFFDLAVREIQKLEVPCVAFIDEGDSALGGDGSSTEGIVNRAMIPLLERIESSRQDKDGVLWVVATNGLRELSPALVSRIQPAFQVPLPPRWATLQIWKQAIEDREIKLLGVNNSHVLELTKGMSPRDIEILVDNLPSRVYLPDLQEACGTIVNSMSLFLKGVGDEKEAFWKQLTSVYKVGRTRESTQSTASGGRLCLPSPSPGRTIILNG